MASRSDAPALPRGSLILVTGTSGYIGSHTAVEALKLGYRVRGTARSQEKAELTRKIVDNHKDYSVAIVPDLQHDGAFDEAMKDVAAVIHVASDTSLDTDPHKVVTPVVQGVKSILKSAAKTPSVKRFVLTSSSVSVYLPEPNKPTTFSTDSWNETASEAAWAPPPYGPDRIMPVYAASKIEGERALWKFMKEEKPSFVANAVLPNMNWGRILYSGGVTGTVVPELAKGTFPMFAPQYMIDVVDDARIHLIAAALDSSLENERIFAFAYPFNWTDAINILKKIQPDNKDIPSPPENEPRDLAKVPNQLGAELLKKWYGQDGYKSMEQTIRENFEEIKVKA